MGKIIRIILIIILILAAVGGGLYLYGGRLILEPTPAEVSVSLDDKAQAQGKRSFRLRPGRHELRIASTGFVDYTETVQIPWLSTVRRSPVLAELPEPIVLTPFPASFLAYDEERNKLIYLSNNGRQLFRVDAALSAASSVKRQASSEETATEGAVQPEPVTPPVLSGISELIWSPNRELVLLRTPAGIILYDLARYNLTSQKAVRLTAGIYGLDWDPEGKKIAYFFEPGSGEKSVIIADPLNKFPVRTTPRFDALSQATLDWSPDGKKIVLVSRGEETKRNVFLLDLFSQELSQLTKDGGYFDAIFTPDSAALMVAKRSADPGATEQGVLSRLSLDGRELTPLNLRARLRTQTTFTSDGLLGFDQSRGLDLVVSDLKGTVTKFATSHELSRPFNPVVGGDSKSLFFIEDGQLVALPLVKASD